MCEESLGRSERRIDNDGGSIRFSLYDLFKVTTFCCCLFAFIKMAGLEGFFDFLALLFVLLILPLVVLSVATGALLGYSRVMSWLFDYFVRPLFFR